MTILDISGDARRAFDVAKKGGIVIFPVDVGYSMIGGSRESLQRIFKTKERGGHKRNALLCDMETQRELHILDSKHQQMIEAITQDYDLPLGAIAPYRVDHPLMNKLDPDSLVGSTAGGTLAMLVNAGPFHAEICRLSREENHPLFGSSANMAPIWDGQAFQPRLMLPLSVSYDHRVIDGAAAARFTTWLSKVLAEVEPLLA